MCVMLVFVDDVWSRQTVCFWMCQCLQLCVCVCVSDLCAIRDSEGVTAHSLTLWCGCVCVCVLSKNMSGSYFTPKLKETHGIKEMKPIIRASFHQKSESHDSRYDFIALWPYFHDSSHYCNVSRWFVIVSFSLMILISLSLNKLHSVCESRSEENRAWFLYRIHYNCWNNGDLTWLL